MRVDGAAFAARNGEGVERNGPLPAVGFDARGRPEPAAVGELAVHFLGQLSPDFVFARAEQFSQHAGFTAGVVAVLVIERWHHSPLATNCNGKNVRSIYKRLS
jgi:hypothetical protein